ncbi:hypothetical protein COHA_005910 [Chlorella ohadii]|uniref:WW domain-containing protein n=1 Tax=Chlorella ohadii TaxID=2649997 RepID=A0AAD5H1D9_9CHLO|nr:hypothetical protein COHA_005910 [Chlorella ohadii]
MRGSQRTAATLLSLALACLAAAAPPADRNEGGQCRTRAPPTPEQRRARRAKECSHLVHVYMQRHTADFEAAHNASKLVFFLHVPRTAGKTYANCFLRTALPPSKRCAKSYDVLRYNVSAPGCLAIISHDDFSAAEQLLPPDAATITQLRRPVDRVVGAYEFAVDVAARGVLHQGPPGKLGRRKSDWVGTLEVWPWSVLIPWFKRDMKARMDRLKEAAKDDPTAWRDYRSPKNRTYWWNEAKNSSVWVLPPPEAVLDPYNNSLVMPLHEWVEHPIAEELMHNGATLQVLGLTNFSHWPRDEAAPLRACLRSNAVAREMLLKLAARRLRAMAHVGLTERLEESVVSMAADLGIDLDGPAYRYTSANAFSYDGGAEDDEALITYNATTAGGANVTVTRWQAAQRANAILDQLREHRLRLDVILPRLRDLVDQETRWLQEQGVPGAASAARSTGVSGRASQVGTAGAACDPQYAPANLAPGSAPQQQQQQQAAAEEPAAVDPEGNEIEALDEEASGRQEANRQLEAELASLHDSDMLVLADQATGHARQLVADEHYLIPNESLGHAYRRCAHAGHTRREKRKPYKHLRTPWGETFTFSTDSRQRIARSTLDRIHRLNTVDEELWREADRILTEKLAAQRSANALQAFPPPPAPFAPQQLPSRKRRLRSLDAPPPLPPADGEGEEGGAAAAAATSTPPASSTQQQQQQQQQQQGSQGAASVPSPATEPVRDEL